MRVVVISSINLPFLNYVWVLADDVQAYKLYFKQFLIVCVSAIRPAEPAVFYSWHHSWCYKDIPPFP